MKWSPALISAIVRNLPHSSSRRPGTLFRDTVKAGDFRRYPDGCTLPNAIVETAIEHGRAG